MANKITNIKDRILQIAKNKSIAYEKFCNDIGMSYGSFKGVARKRPINSDAIETIITSFNDVNSEWLITGKGDMLKNSVEEKETIIVENTESNLLKDKYIEVLEENIQLRKKIEKLEKSSIVKKSTVNV